MSALNHNGLLFTSHLPSTTRLSFKPLCCCVDGPKLQHDSRPQGSRRMDFTHSEGLRNLQKKQKEKKSLRTEKCQIILQHFKIKNPLSFILLFTSILIDENVQHIPEALTNHMLTCCMVSSQGRSHWSTPLVNKKVMATLLLKQKKKNTKHPKVLSFS